MRRSPPLVVRGPTRAYTQVRPYDRNAGLLGVRASRPHYPGVRPPAATSGPFLFSGKTLLGSSKAAIPTGCRSPRERRAPARHRGRVDRRSGRAAARHALGSAIFFTESASSRGRVRALSAYPRYGLRRYPARDRSRIKWAPSQGPRRMDPTAPSWH